MEMKALKSSRTVRPYTIPIISCRHGNRTFPSFLYRRCSNSGRPASSLCARARRILTELRDEAVGHAEEVGLCWREFFNRSAYGTQPGSEQPVMHRS